MTIRIQALAFATILSLSLWALIGFGIAAVFG